MSIKGRDYTWFRASIDRGDLAGAWSAAHAMPHKLILPDALDLLLLIGQQWPEKYERAAVKWAGRLLLERPTLTLEQAELAVAVLDRAEDEEAAAILRRLAKL